MRLVLALAVLTLTGCYSVMTVNLGVNHQASTTGKQLPPEVLCAALAKAGVKMDGATIEAVNNCVEATTMQKATR
jgi:hypothetical protein